jgi:hypothetical protein
MAAQHEKDLFIACGKEQEHQLHLPYGMAKSNTLGRRQSIDGCLQARTKHRLPRP